MVSKGMNRNAHFVAGFIFLLLLKCSSAPETSKQIKFDHAALGKILDKHGNNIALLSCLRCGCFVDVYNKGFIENGIQPTEYVLIADTLCNKFLFQVNFLSSEDIEKISDEIYNLTLIKRRNNVITSKILQVEDSKNLEKAVRSFFKN